MSVETPLVYLSITVMNIPFGSTKHNCVIVVHEYCNLSSSNLWISIYGINLSCSNSKYILFLDPCVGTNVTAFWVSIALVCHVVVYPFYLQHLMLGMEHWSGDIFGSKVVWTWVHTRCSSVAYHVQGRPLQCYASQASVSFWTQMILQFPELLMKSHEKLSSTAELWNGQW